MKKVIQMGIDKDEEKHTFTTLYTKIENGIQEQEEKSYNRKPKTFGFTMPYEVRFVNHENQLLGVHMDLSFDIFNLFPYKIISILFALTIVTTVVIIILSIFNLTVVISCIFVLIILSSAIIIAYAGKTYRKQYMFDKSKNLFAKHTSILGLTWKREWKLDMVHAVRIQKFTRNPEFIQIIVLYSDGKKEILYNTVNKKEATDYSMQISKFLDIEIRDES